MTNSSQAAAGPSNGRTDIGRAFWRMASSARAELVPVARTSSLFIASCRAGKCTCASMRGTLDLRGVHGFEHGRAPNLRQAMQNFGLKLTAQAGLNFGNDGVGELGPAADGLR